MVVIDYVLLLDTTRTLKHIMKYTEKGCHQSSSIIIIIHDTELSVSASAQLLTMSMTSM